MIREENKAFLEECKEEISLFSKAQMIEEFSTMCADVMEFMDEKLNEELVAELVLALTISSGKTIKRLFKENKNMANYSEREDV